MTEITVRGKETLKRDVEVLIDVFDFLDGMNVDICKVPNDAYYDEKDNTVKTAEDTSYHGSPTYEYTTYNLTENKLAIMKKISEMKQLLRKEYEINKLYEYT